MVNVNIVPRTMSFDQRMMPHLEALAAVLLANRMYHRLSLVASLLAGFGDGRWQLLSADHQELLVRQMADGFHGRAWDDWETRDSTLSTIRELIHAELRALRAME